MTGPKLRAGERGQIVVFAAVSLVALIGMAALSIDAAYMYDNWWFNKAGTMPFEVLAQRENRKRVGTSGRDVLIGSPLFLAQG